MTKKILQEVNIIRPIVIALLVFIHAFAIFGGGGWALPNGVEDIKLYHYLPSIIRGFRIETIAFIAGYVFSYQSNDLGRTYSLLGIIKKKFVRLIIPCWIFGIFYALCFCRASSIINNLISILNGIGHLWFLTMLFWCFLALFFIDKYYNKYGFRGKGGIILFLCLSAASCIPIPVEIPTMGLNRMPHFLFFTYLGYLFYIYKDKIFNFLKNKYLLIFALYLVFVGLSFFVLPSLREQQSSFSLMYIAIYISLKISQYLMAISGISFLYIIVMKFLKKKGTEYVLPNYITKSNKMCYGVYVFHQFLLIYLYYHTSIPMYINSYLLPFISFVTVLIVSILLSKIFLMTRFGRFLIG